MRRRRRVRLARPRAAGRAAPAARVVRARGGGGPGGPGGAATSTVGIATAKKADIPVQLEALGTVTPLANVVVQPQVSGVLTAVLFQEGQMVKKGDVLATIDPQPFQNALAQATGARQRDEAQLAAARVTLSRYQTLLGQDSIARQDVDTQAALVKQLEGTVAIDRANENTAKLNLTWSRITAPVSGRIGLRPVDAGNYISTGATNGIATITQITPIDVEFAIPQDRVPEVQDRLAQGAKLDATAFDRTRTRRLATGAFATLDNLVDTATGTVKAKARFSNADNTLFPNQFVNLRLLLRTVDSAVVVPVTALRHGPNGDYVYVLKDDSTVAQRTVTRGEASVDNVAIMSGLTAGEQVVTEGGDRLKDGARVQTTVDRPAAPPAGAASGERRGHRGNGERGSGRREGGAAGAGAPSGGAGAGTGAEGAGTRQRPSSSDSSTPSVPPPAPAVQPGTPPAAPGGTMR
ncbi:efflux RND transporter periplasmic adaptor subunit [Variovorax paradoxus]|uniref:efflux RND transporter periplasmic adaptor subunit n=1 Tax=Variovorax paradoxus TaxID=34073 RepID=UPI003075BE7B